MRSVWASAQHASRRKASSLRRMHICHAHVQHCRAAVGAVGRMTSRQRRGAPTARHTCYVTRPAANCGAQPAGDALPSACCRPATCCGPACLVRAPCLALRICADARSGQHEANAGLPSPPLQPNMAVPGGAAAALIAGGRPRRRARQAASMLIATNCLHCCRARCSWAVLEGFCPRSVQFGGPGAEAQQAAGTGHYRWR